VKCRRLGQPELIGLEPLLGIPELKTASRGRSMRYSDPRSTSEGPTPLRDGVSVSTTSVACSGWTRQQSERCVTSSSTGPPPRSSKAKGWRDRTLMLVHSFSNIDAGFGDYVAFVDLEGTPIRGGVSRVGVRRYTAWATDLTG